MKWIFIIHFVCSIFMLGLCWFVQVVHYPLFKEISIEDFSAYEKKNFVTGYITVPVMIIEIFTGLILLYFNLDLLHVFNVVFLAIIWLSTAIYQVPIHLKLTKEPSLKLINRLIKTNWTRTISWTVRMVILVILLNQLIH